MLNYKLQVELNATFGTEGGKVKNFLPILEAAAGGKLESKENSHRSLESVDFRSCVYLTDVDVNALCVLHSRVSTLNVICINCNVEVGVDLLIFFSASRAALASSTYWLETKDDLNGSQKGI